MLLNPPVHHYAGIQYRMNPPLGLPILSAVLRRAGHTCEVTDLEALGVGPDRLRAVWAAQRDRWPDVVGITALTSSARGMRDTIQALRGAGYGGRIVVGGVHATLAPDDCLASGADLVVTGECDANIVSLLEREEVGIQVGIAPAIADVPLPDWDHHNPAPSAYAGNYPMLTNPQSISMWSRGCPFNCVFCGNIVMHGATRYRPPAHIHAEMVDLKARHINSVFVYDDELVGTRHPVGWMADIADRIGELGIEWKGQGRCSERFTTLEVLRDCRRAGCRVMMWGIESFSPRVLKAVRKATTPAGIWTTLRRSKEAGIRNWAFTMVGNIEETEDDLAETARCLAAAYREGLIDYRQTTVVTALPGTELERMQKHGGWYTQPPDTGAQMHQVFTDTPWLKADRIQYWLRKFDEVCPANHVGRAVA